MPANGAPTNGCAAEMPHLFQRLVQHGTQMLVRGCVSPQGGANLQPVVHSLSSNRRSRSRFSIGYSATSAREGQRFSLCTHLVAPCAFPLH